MGKREREHEEPEAKEDSKMDKVLEHLKKQLTEANKLLLTMADTNSYRLVKSGKDVGEIVLTWRLKRPDFVAEPIIQTDDDCWAHALAGGMTAAMKQLGRTGNFPTAEELISRIDANLLSATKALPRVEDAAPMLRQYYNCELVVHHRPKLSLVEKNKDFEKFIERRLATGQVAMCFPYLAGYARFSQDLPTEKKKAVFRPSVADIQQLRNEKIDDHCSVITGRGMVLKNGELVEFFEIQETRGKYFADGGCTRLERYKGIVTEVYEFKFL
ncbi:PREDICTED: uncharacterized protein LOC104737698 isoform X2 [Camelina sativa]|uniref:Uncharacterized protein LOC104737698 isoform X2 n=1 Tax=Camelina sativa TaxID=90675 RepID=A0ABM0VHK0_CAMSA|nr:PREDICTED: uncharacterized protein LOC104737698 isoform X2 [Camelina sativa]